MNIWKQIPENAGKRSPDESLKEIISVISNMKTDNLLRSQMIALIRIQTIAIETVTGETITFKENNNDNYSIS